MKNRTTPKNRTVGKKSNKHDYSTKSTPSLKEVINELLRGKAIHHTDWTKSHNGEQHRLGITIHRLRNEFEFGKLIQCPRGSEHPLQYHYFIAPSDIPVCTQIAKDKGLWMGEAA